MKRVVIIGGGITGLAAAFYLEKYAREKDVPINTTLVEKSDRLGGKLWTRKDGDFLMEQGPDSFITQKPYATDLCKELGLTEDILPCRLENQRVMVAYKGKLVPVPDGFKLAGPANLKAVFTSPLFSLPSKIRMTLEPLIPPRKSDDDESMASFITRRFGREVLEKLAGPMMSGIYMGDPADLSMQASFPHFLELEKKYGSIIRGFWAMSKRGKKSDSAQPLFVSLRNGMEQLALTLENKLTCNVEKNTAVKSFSREKDDSYSIELDNGENTPGGPCTYLPAPSCNCTAS